jgi:MurNAc alpha-1-phosphate uridylyltransferase
MKAMLLAAGRGERMRPLTDHTPKPLLKVADKALIVWHIEKLVAAGITELIINHAHLGAQIETALGNGHQFGAQITYSPETAALETAGGIAQALPLLDDRCFAVINSDIYCDYDFNRLPDCAAALHFCDDDAHLILVDNPEHHPDGDFCLTANRITSFRTPSVTLHPASCLTFSGIGLYHPRFFSPIPRGSIAPLAPLLRKSIVKNKVSGEYHSGTWIDVGTPQRLETLDRQLRTTKP